MGVLHAILNSALTFRLQQLPCSPSPLAWDASIRPSILDREGGHERTVDSSLVDIVEFVCCGIGRL